MSTPLRIGIAWRHDPNGRIVLKSRNSKGKIMEIDAYLRVLAEAVNAPESLVRMAMRDNPPGYQEFLERLSELAPPDAEDSK
jgi:hypothetical protein